MLFWSVFSRIRTEYEKIQSISPYSAEMWENADQNNSEYGYFLRNESCRPKTCNFNKKEALTQMLSCEFWKTFKNTFFTKHFQATASVMLAVNSARGKQALHSFVG